jgi:DNA polymerase-3 subunit alpha (Gram-positive type)
LDQKWKKLIYGCGFDEYVDMLVFRGAVVSKKAKRMELRLECSGFIPYRKIKSIEGVIAEKLSGRAGAFFSLPENCKEEDISAFISERLKDDQPLAWGLIESVCLKNGVMRIEAYKNAGDFFEQNDVEGIIRDSVKSYFGIDIKTEVAFSVDAAVSAAAEATPAQYMKIEGGTAKSPPKALVVDKTPTTVKKKSQIIRTLLGKPIKAAPISMSSLEEDSGRVVIEGDVFAVEARDMRRPSPKQRQILIIKITDYTGSVPAKLILGDDNLSLAKSIKVGMRLKVRGDYGRSRMGSMEIWPYAICEMPEPEKRTDNAPQKRVELHAHTHMSNMDAMVSARTLVDTAAAWGHKAIAITDHGVVQSFPDAFEAAAKHKDFKVIFGLEGYLVADARIVTNADGRDLDGRFVVFDIETTGLKPNLDAITEIGAVLVEGGKIISEYHSYVNPVRRIPPEITKLTGISDETVQNAPRINEVLPEFLAFCEGACLVAHNAQFDMGFIKAAARRGDIEVEHPVLDTLLLARSLLPSMKSHRLDALAKHFKVALTHHRADSDAKATANILLKLFAPLKKSGVKTLGQIDRKLTAIAGRVDSSHIILLAKNPAGLVNLYKIVTASHLKYFANKRPRIPRSLLLDHREGLIIGSACEQGELYKAIIGGTPDSELEKIAGLYDYLEIQPIDNNMFLLIQGEVSDIEELRDINRKIVALADKLEKPVVAAGDVHFLNPYDEYYRRIIMHGQNFDQADQQPPLYFKTTEEMLNEFSYLGENKAKEAVIYNPLAIADSIEDMRPFPAETHMPKIEGADEDIRDMSYKKAREIYGDPLPDIVSARLDKEIGAITKYGYGVLYYIAHKLVEQSMAEGYLVGSRGSVGSSLVAMLSGITEINPLSPHYVCPSCRHSNFDVDAQAYPCGVDLPEDDCPKCGSRFRTDGYEIPFEAFLGFEGDKVPDIDLNFSGDYQPRAHKQIEDIFGAGHVFRAGTVSTLQNKTAYGYVLKYAEDHALDLSEAEKDRLASACAGVKRTTGQHPGGIIIVPKDIDVHNFTPLQHPSDSKEKGVITTHFDFNSMHDTLVKVDVLGHDVPTMLRELELITEVKPMGIPLNDKKTMRLFKDCEPLGVLPEQIGTPVGTYGIPEFGTPFVRQMLIETQPESMAELVRISGLSHGTDVWTGNAQELIKNDGLTLKDVLCTREDIMNYLISRGVDSKTAFMTMESVRKGRGLNAGMEEAMEKNDIPMWFRESCKKIQYMFPKAHAAAYVVMAFRLAWFKVYMPEAFYAVYFSVKADEFDMDMVSGGMSKVRKRLDELNVKGMAASPREKSIVAILELAVEMMARGIEFLPVHLEKSAAKHFTIEDGRLRMPFRAVPGLGESVAEEIIVERGKAPFLSVEDLQKRARVNKTVTDALIKSGCLAGLPMSNQLSLF